MKAIAMRKKLIQRAKNLLRAGYSVIPVQGNNSPGEPKKPAVSWRTYQSRVPTESEIERLFDKKVTALGIVCGRISKLLVIDFDDLLRYQRFCRHLPQYSETYTVKTKRGFHLYFRTTERYRVISLRAVTLKARSHTSLRHHRRSGHSRTAARKMRRRLLCTSRMWIGC